MIRITKIVEKFDHHMEREFTSQWYEILEDAEVNSIVGFYINYYSKTTHYTPGQLARRLLNRHKVKKMEAMLDG